jgi:hypothetical protein
VLKVRKEQMEALAGVAVEAFLDEMVAHFVRSLPERCRALGAVGLRDALRHGVGRGEVYGIVEEAEVHVYLGMVLDCGRRFDEEQPWARGVLKDARSPGPAASIVHLYRAYEEHVVRGNARAESMEP